MSEHTTTVTALQALIDPRSICVIGASERNFYSRNVILNLQRHGFSGDIHPVNPRGGTVLGLGCFQHVSEAPDFDVAVIAVGRARYLEAVRDAVSHGARAIVALTAGLAETREPEWVDVEREAVQLAAESGCVIVGPNGLGFVNAANGALAFGAPVVWDIPVGGTGLVMQSGGLLLSSLSSMAATGCAIRYAASVGNGSSVGVNDWLAVMAQDSDVRQVGVMLEAIPEWARFSGAARDLASAGKRVFALATGKSEAGARAAATHTGALASDHRVTAQVLSQVGISQTTTLPGLLTALALQERFGNPTGRSVAVLVASGGAAGVAADASSSVDLSIKPFSADLRADLTGEIGILDVSNPLDVGGQALADPEGFERVLTRLLAEDEYGAVLYSPTVGLPDSRVQEHLGLAEIAARAGEQAGKPVVLTQLALGDGTPEAVEHFKDSSGLVTVPVLEHAIDALAAWLDGGPTPESATTGDDDEAQVDPPSPSGIDEAQMKEILRTAGIATPDQQVYRPGAGPAELTFARAVLKAQVPGVLHKSRHGLVSLGIEETSQLRAEEARIARAAADIGADDLEFLLEEMVAPGVDLFVSISEQAFGTMATIGFGGTDVEDRDDVAFIPLPSPAREIEHLVAPYVPTSDRTGELARLIDTLTTVYRDQSLTTLEINPVRMTDNGCVALDAVAIRGN